MADKWPPVDTAADETAMKPAMMAKQRFGLEPVCHWQAGRQAGRQAMATLNRNQRIDNK